MSCTPLDKLDTPERLLEIARCIREFGPDITAWGDPKHVANLLVEHSNRVRIERYWNKEPKS